MEYILYPQAKLNFIIDNVYKLQILESIKSLTTVTKKSILNWEDSLKFSNVTIWILKSVWRWLAQILSQLELVSTNSRVQNCSKSAFYYSHRWRGQHSPLTTGRHRQVAAGGWNCHQWPGRPSTARDSYRHPIW